jgi:DNA-binding protein H-NS
MPVKPPDSRIPDFEQMSEAETMAFVEAFLNRLSLEGIAVVIAAAQDKQREKQDQVREALLQEFNERAAAMGMRVRLEPLDTPALNRKSRSNAGQPLSAKFRGPNGETWSGRGHQPRWMTALELTGRTKDEFLIREEQT